MVWRNYESRVLASKQELSLFKAQPSSSEAGWVRALDGESPVQKEG